jgi:uncharacterized protein (TIGR00290 family)
VAAVKPRAVVSWSSGKDSAYALHQVSASVDLVGLLTTVTADYERVSIHGVRESILEAQATALGLPLRKVRVAAGCSLGDYEAGIGEALAQLRADGITHVVFGDIFLADVRAYREAQLARHGLTGVFPLWGRQTGELAREMIGAGMSAVISCVDLRVLDRSFAGRRWDALLDELPPAIDPCAEAGEFHTCVTHGPMFREPIAVHVGEVVERESFAFADVRL